MKYIRIKNDGIIEPQALHLVGASTKRNDRTKIGQFGSGNKYALAYLLRNDYPVKVFAGTDEITLETRPEVFREQQFDVLYVNGEKTSITIDMGKDWEFWQAIREIYCNALDEGGCELEMVNHVEPKEGETHFYIDTRKDVMEFMSNFDNYFATNKRVLFECEAGRILEKTGTTANLYRKGIKCLNTNRKSVFDYDLTDIRIDENRLVMCSWHVEEKIWDLIYQCDKEEVILQILHNSHDSELLEGCVSDYSTINASNISETFKDTLRKINLAPKGYSGLLKPDELHTHVVIPTKVFQSVRGVLKDENVGDKFKVSRHGGMYREIETSPLHEATIKQARYFLSEVGFEVPYEIQVAIFDEKEIMGCASDGKIILSDVCLEKGVNETVNSIIEEYIHLKYDVQDETRSFQTALITEFITYMKKQNAFVI